MLKEKSKKIIYLILLMAWMIAVFIFSNENGSQSQETSRSVTKAIVHILTYNQNITEAEEIILIENTDFIIRKLAHFSIYAIGGILIYNYINTYNLSVKRKFIISVLIGIIYAIFDEFHQYFVADRSAQIFDVFIDSSGVTIGVIFIYLINKIKKPLNK